MKKIYDFLLILFIPLFLFSSCEKDGLDSREDVFNSIGCWRNVKIEFYDYIENDWNNFYLDDCILDDCYHFQENGSFTFDNGSLFCVRPSQKTVTGVWKLENNGQTLLISIPNDDAQRFSIVDVTRTRFVLEQPVIDFGPYSKRKETYEPDSVAIKSAIFFAVSRWCLQKTETLDPSTKLWEPVVLEACKTDDCFIFRADGSYSEDFGVLRCSPSESENIEGNWKLRRQGHKLILEFVSGGGFNIQVAYEDIGLSNEKIVLIGDKERYTYMPR
ncbi:MAG: hypothetical protein IPH93_09025 [Saprospiraceae bacterium]|nr:hypothetical protein [Saprospiraceae bacterium]MBK7810635.1 hypothetical protein [Saprospiraceae bacterium]